MRYMILLLTSIFIMTGCKEEQTVQSEYNEPYLKWSSYGYHNYTIEQTRQCFCIYGGEPMRVIVRNDTVKSVTRISDNKVLSYSESRSYLSIKSLFQKILNPGKDSIVVSFNSQYGYPEKVDINPQLHPVDGGDLYLITKLQVP